MSEALAVAGPFAGAQAASRSLARWVAWRGRRMLASIRARWRAYQLYRDSQIFLTRLDEKLLYDIGMEPLDLIEQVRKARERRLKFDPPQGR